MIDQVHVARYENLSITNNARSIIEHIVPLMSWRVTLFGSMREGGPPRLNALASYSILHFGIVHVVFDGDFLNADTRLGLQQVRDVLNAAQRSTKVTVCLAPLKDTSSLSPVEAANSMLAAAMNEGCTGVSPQSLSLFMALVYPQSIDHPVPNDRRRSAGANNASRLQA